MGSAWGMAGLGLFGMGALADMFDMEQAMGYLLYLTTGLALSLVPPWQEIFHRRMKILDHGEKNG